MTGTETCADELEGILDQHGLGFLFYPVLAKEHCLCFGIELIQIKKAFPLLNGRGKKERKDKKGKKLILTMYSFETKYIPFPLS